MPIILQNLAVFLDGFFIMVGSNATYTVVFLIFCNLLDRSYGKAINECSRLQPPEKDIATRKVERKSAFYSGAVFILMTVLGIVLTIYNTSRIDILGGIITALFCLVNFIFYLFD